ncbi:KEA5 [Symbiodinium microadriaticum]|nr:KEA5 [Symbiodinium microadriaticum]
MDDGSQHGCECMALRRHYLAVTSFAAGLGRRSVAQMEPAAKAARVEADGPTLTAYSMAGAVLWGPSKVHKGMTVAELASTLDRPSTSPGLKIACKESMLEPGADLSQLADPSELFVHFDPPKPFDHSFVKELIELAQECEDNEFLAPRRMEALWENHQSKLVREGVTFETHPQEAADELNRLVEELKEKSAKDYHPGTDEIVRDLVHPSLYPFVEGVSQTAGTDDVTPAVTVQGLQQDMWGRPYETSKYQWLPSEVSVAADGTCKFQTYINNLDQEKYGELCGALERLLTRCLPHLEAAWSHGQQVKGLDDENEDMFDSDCSAGEPENIEIQSLRGRSIQVITKIVDYELPPGGTHEGVWHVEGMSHENIVATAELILKKDAALVGGGLQFQRTFRPNEGCAMIAGFPQCRAAQMDEVVKAGLVPLGQLPLPHRRLAAWPNSHIHKVENISNTSESLAVRRIVVFWLVNPGVRIISTQHVPKQQGVMPLEEAQNHRLSLMEERKLHKQNWNLREVSLCEH